MILPSFVLASKKNLVLTKSGLDSLSNCFDKKKFKDYPYAVEYRYNDRGFRDENWPNSINELTQLVWCFGDSFTVGLGAPIEHTWPYVLQQTINRRCINISMDGASNDWIARRAIEVIQTIRPAVIIIMWSFSSRREKEATDDDETRRMHLHAGVGDYLDDFKNFQNNVNAVNAAATSTKIIHSAIPAEFFTVNGVQECFNTLRGTDWPSSFTGIKNLNQLAFNELKKSNMYEMFQTYDKFEHEIIDLTEKFVNIKQVDFSRDSYHFGVRTMTQIANDFVNLI